MIDVITAVIAGIAGMGALVGLMSWAQSQRESNLRQRAYNYHWPERGHYSGTCVCTPGRELDLSEPGTYDATVEVNIGYADAATIDRLMGQERRQVEEIPQPARRQVAAPQPARRRQTVAIPQPAQPAVVAPQPHRRRRRALPQPHTTETPAQPATVDGGYRWVALEREINHGEVNHG